MIATAFRLVGQKAGRTRHPSVPLTREFVHGGAMREIHFPNARPASSLFGSAILLLISLSPQDAINNVRSAIDFIGYGAPPWFSAEVLAGGARVAAITLCLALLVWGFWPARKRRDLGAIPSSESEPPQTADQAPPHKLLLAFSEVPANIKIPNEGIAHYFEAHETDSIGLGTIFAHPGTDIIWPNREKMIPGRVTKCTITNYGPETLIDIVISATPVLREMIYGDLFQNGSQACTPGEVVKQTNAWITIDKIGVGDGNSFIFYMTNTTPYEVELVLPGRARVKTVGSDEPSTALLSRAGGRGATRMLPRLKPPT